MMTFLNGVAYLQAGGGIVFDSVEEDEYIETINKLGANVRTIDRAEGTYAASSSSYSRTEARTLSFGFVCRILRKTKVLRRTSQDFYLEMMMMMHSGVNAAEICQGAKWREGSNRNEAEGHHRHLDYDSSIGGEEEEVWDFRELAREWQQHGRLGRQRSPSRLWESISQLFVLLTR